MSKDDMPKPNPQLLRDSFLDPKSGKLIPTSSIKDNDDLARRIAKHQFQLKAGFFLHTMFSAALGAAIALAVDQWF
jgi:hypothetical protein